MSSSTMPSSSPPRGSSSSAAGRSSSPTIEFTNLTEAAAVLATYKRRLATVNEQLAEATHSQPKRPATTKTMGRGIRKLGVVTLFDSLSSILDEADRRNTEGPVAVEADPQRKRARDRTFRSYPLFLQLVPYLKTVILEKTVDDLNAFIADLQEGANSARSDDIKRIKEEVYARINKEYKPDVPLERSTRDNRGLQHDVCGGLLTPIMFDWNNPEVRANIRGSKEGYIISSNYYLTCLYGKGRFDPKKIELGFLRSKLLLQVYCAIFTSPSSAEGIEEEEDVDEGPPRKKQKSARATKSCVSSLLNMDGKVTGRSIAYAAVLMVFNLTEAVQWVDVYNNFSFVGFYNFLVDYFEEAEDRGINALRRVNDLLDWWNSQVFPHHVSVTANSDESRDLLLNQDDDY